MAAYTQKDNVIRITDDNDTVPGILNICGIKYIGQTNGSISIKADQSSSGMVLWEESGAANVYNHVSIRSKDGIWVDVANGAVVYLYLETE